MNDIYLRDIKLYGGTPEERNDLMMAIGEDLELFSHSFWAYSCLVNSREMLCETSERHPSIGIRVIREERTREDERAVEKVVELSIFWYLGGRLIKEEHPFYTPDWRYAKRVRFPSKSTVDFQISNVKTIKEGRSFIGLTADSKWRLRGKQYNETLRYDIPAWEDIDKDTNVELI